MACLTGHDDSILKVLFNPEASTSERARIDERLPSLRPFSEPAFAAIRAEEQTILRALDEPSPATDTVTDTIHQLDELIHQHPEYASAYVNRAQAVRLRLSADQLFTTAHSEESAKLIESLGRAISCGSPAAPSDAVSPHQASVLAAAYTHRGLLMLRIADLSGRGRTVRGVSKEIRAASRDQIEESASGDFLVGGRYGNKIAQQMSVKTNPYAKMCGAIVKEAMQKEIDEYRAGRDGRNVV